MLINFIASYGSRRCGIFLRRFFIVFLVIIFFASAKIVNAATYYVDADIGDINSASATPDCTNYNPTTFQCSGGSDSAYKSIADLNAKTFNPGDNIYFKRGTTWYLDDDNVGLVFLGSGTSGNPITIDAFGSGDKPLLTGETSAGGTGLPTGWTQANLLDSTIISNGTMESGGEGNPPTDWTNVSNGTSLGSTTRVHGGTYSLKFTRDAVGGDGFVKSTNIAVTEGVRYYISAWVWVDSATKVELWEKISSSSEFALVQSSVRTNNWGWEKLTGFATAGLSTSTAEVMLKVYGSDGQLVYIDDVAVQPPETVANSYYKYTGYDPNRIVTYTKDGTTTALKLNEGAEMNVGLNEWDRTQSGWLYVNVGEDPDNGMIKASRTGYPVRFIGNDYISFKNIAVKYATVYGIYVYNDASNIIFDGITAQWNGLDGLNIYGTPNTTIQNSLITNNGRNGVYLEDGSIDALITSNEFSYNGLLGIDGDRDGVGLGGAIGQNNNGIISYNNIHHNYSHGATTFKTSNVVVEHNTLADNYYTNPSTLGDVYFGYGTGNIARYNFISSPRGIGFQGVNLSNGGYSNPSAYYNVINCNDVSGSHGIYADQTPVNVGDIFIANNTIYGCDTGIYTHLTFSGGTVTSKNNIVVVDGSTEEAVEYRKTDMISSDYNLFANLLGDSSRLAVWGSTGYNQDQWLNYKSVSNQDTNSLTPTDPLFTAIGSDFTLLWNSPSIDTGVDVSLTTDRAGNPIYGTPDIGGYEYQPPYVMGTNEVDLVANVRVYGDGKFRNTQSPGGISADLSIVPASNNKSQSLDVSINTWETSGSYSKEWTETSTTITGNVAHTVGDLESGKNYHVTVDGGTSNLSGCSMSGSNYVCQANGSGEISFTYTGTYSAHTFNVDGGDNSSSSSSFNSPPSAPVCSDKSPAGQPDLFQIDRTGGTAKLYFTPVNDKVETYSVIYGFHDGDERFGGIRMAAQNENQGVQSITVEHLDPKASYSFKVVSVNGCAPGEWSNWLSVGKVQAKTSIFYRYWDKVRNLFR
jgi:hypothetical protein